MSKILLVEDDNNLREIYEARLLAEGYDIVSAQDGEEALVKAKQEKPDLIVSDVMMPRISGFEMLDILRNTEGLKHTKVIMLTALGQAEDQTRADSLGADRYLVKSQVTLEDIVKAAQELLSQQAAAPANASAPIINAPVIPETPQVSQPTAPAGSPVMPPAEKPAPAPAGAPVAPPQEPAAAAAPVSATPSTTPTPSIPVVQAPAVSSSTAAPINPALPPTPIAPTPTVNTPAMPTPQPTASSTPAPAQPASVSTPSAAQATTLPNPPAHATPGAPASQSATPQTSQPTAPTQSTPATPAATTPAEPKPAAAPAPNAPQPAEAAKAPETSPSEATPEPATDSSQVDDKLIADAMKSLTASLSSDSEAIEKPESTEKPEVPAESSSVVKEVAPKPTSKPDALSTPPAAPEKHEAPNAMPPENTFQESSPQAPSVTAPAQPASPAVEPDLDLTASQLPGVTGVSSPVSAPAPPKTEPTPEPSAAPAAPEAEQPLATEEKALENTASTADEQAVMKQQIDNFIKQQDARQADQKSEIPTATSPAETTSPVAQPEEPASVAPQPEVPAAQEVQNTPQTTPMSVSEAPAEPFNTPTSAVTAEAAPSVPTTFKPDTVSEPAPSAAPAEADESQPESVAIAHKKIIQPPVEPMTNQPNLSELLAREGMNFDDNPLPSGPVTSGGSFAQPPHQPGHVISPGVQGVPVQPPATSSLNPDDPNNIAL